MKSNRRAISKAAKSSRKLASINNPSGQSNYARKAEYCKKNGVNAAQVKEPKPWKN